MAAEEEADEPVALLFLFLIGTEAATERWRPPSLIGPCKTIAGRWTVFWSGPDLVTIRLVDYIGSGHVNRLINVYTCRYL
jgi:hypothetical protein